MKSIHNFKEGLRDGLPIGLGYLSVSFAFGMLAVSQNVPLWVVILMSMTNLTSAGQVAGLSIIVTGGSYLEMLLTELIINIRYSLMSVSLSQKCDNSMKIPQRMTTSFFITDEIFALSMTKEGNIGSSYLYGIGIMPYIGWASGTAIGAILAGIMPPLVQSALGIAIYGMFLAVFVPIAKVSRPVFYVVASSTFISLFLYYCPLTKAVPGGFSVIISTITASAIGAILFPVKINENGEVQNG